MRNWNRGNVIKTKFVVLLLSLLGVGICPQGRALGSTLLKGTCVSQVDGAARRPPKVKRPPKDDLSINLNRFKNGNVAAFELLVSEMSPSLKRYLTQYLGNADDAEDVTQETWIQVWGKIRLFKPDQPARPWIYSIATHKAVDLLRKRGRRPQTASLDHPQNQLPDSDEDSSFDPNDELELGPVINTLLSEQDKIIEEALQKISPALSATVRLVYFEELKYKEAAEVLDIPTGTVKSRLHAALKLLKPILHSKIANNN